MKKALKITGIVLGIVIILVIAAALTFPGAYHYYNVKKTCTKINLTSQPYPYTDVAVPEDWTEITANGITMKIPTDMFLKETSTNAEIYVDGTEDNVTKTAFISGEFEWGEFDLYNEAAHDDEHTKEDYIEFYECIGLEYPESYCEMYQGFYDLSMEDFNIHSFKDSTAFATIALMKEILVSNSISEIYETEIDGCTAFIQMYKDEEDSEIKNRCVVEIYTEGSPEISYSVIIGAQNEETLRQMIASIGITEE